MTLPAGAPLAAFELRLQPIDLFEEDAGMFEHGLADIAEFGATTVAPQQKRAAFAFELADVAAQGGLRHAEIARRQREAAEFADTSKIAKALEIHDRSVVL